MALRSFSWIVTCLLLGGGVLLGATGCAERDAASLPKKPRSASTEPAEVVDPAGEHVEEEANDRPDEQKESEQSSAAGEISEEVPYERLIVLTTSGPLLVDLQLTIDGAHYASGVDSLVQLVLAAADTDENGIPTWDELADNERFLAGPLVRERGNLGGEAGRWKEQYDIDRNGWISGSEARAWLGRDDGRAARSLTLESARERYYDPRRSSHVWMLFDADGTGQLTADEWSDAPARLAARDADADGVLYVHDLESLRDQLRATEAIPVMSSSRRADRRAAFLVHEDADWQLIAATLSDAYAVGHTLTADSFPGLPELFDALDNDSSGRLSHSELHGLLTLAAHIRLQVDFASTKASEPVAAITYGEPPEPTATGAEVLAATPTRLTARIAEAAVVFSLHDGLPGKDYSQIAGERLAALDQDDSGYLDREELAKEGPDAVESFVALDADEDGMIVADEIAEYVRLEDAVARSQIRIVVHDQADALFEHLDADQDGRLGEREIATAADRLAKLDTNGDGRLTASEIAGQLHVAFLRGVSNNQTNQMDAFPYLTVGTTSRADEPDAPAWFVRGDFNGDGDVSRREFIGTPDQFSRLDADGDGFITAREAQLE